MTLIQRLIGPETVPPVKVTGETCKICRGTGVMLVVAEKGVEEKISCPHCRGTGRVLD
ncbi:MAG TPA: hypothetical protein VFJ63_01820 [Candidatus Bathyarchaeia archaeon]|nr:hypothetical protein [Candidatus Bathyarchaeia archaeon]